MAMRALPLSSSANCCPPATMSSFNIYSLKPRRTSNGYGGVWAMAEKKDGKEEQEAKKKEQSLLSGIIDALDFSQVRSEKDSELLDEARGATMSGEKMTREQYGALRRKIGGTYKDFFKSYVDVDGQYVEEGWVDKTCKVCKKDTRGEPRQKDNLGRYVHVACLEKSKSSNFFSRLFSG